jgi:putative transposase
MLARLREIGPVCVRASSTLLNGSEQRSDEEAPAHAGADRPQVAGSRSGWWARVELPDVTKTLEVSEATYHRWRAQYGRMRADDVKRLKEFEVENARLNRIVADQTLPVQALKEIAKGNW